MFFRQKSYKTRAPKHWIWHWKNKCKSSGICDDYQKQWPKNNVYAHEKKSMRHKKCFVWYVYDIKEPGEVLTHWRACQHNICGAERYIFGCITTNDIGLPPTWILHWAWAWVRTLFLGSVNKSFIITKKNYQSSGRRSGSENTEGVRTLLSMETPCFFSLAIKESWAQMRVVKWQGNGHRPLQQ